MVIRITRGYQNYFTLALPDLLVRQIPKYAAKLAQETSTNPSKQRLTITDSEARREEDIMRLVEFLMDGQLPHFDITDALTHDSALDFYDLAIALECRSASEAVLAQIDQSPVGRFEDLFVWAEKVYKMTTSYKPRYAPDSALGQLIKKKLTEFLPTLVAGSGKDALKKASETLSKQFMEVMMENWENGGMAKKPGEAIVIKIEED